jgi:hypothetical protein
VVDPGDPRHQPLPLDGTVVSAFLDTAPGRLSREQSGESRHGGGAPRLGKHLRALRHRQYATTCKWWCRAHIDLAFCDTCMGRMDARSSVRSQPAAVVKSVFPRLCQPAGTNCANHEPAVPAPNKSTVPGYST